MEFKDLAKKYWFVALIAVIMLVFIGFYTADTIKNKPVTVKTLKNDGKDVVFTVDDDYYYYADDLYDSLFEAYGKNVGFATFYREVIDKTIETTDELSENASAWAQSALQQNTEEELLSYLGQSGYTSIDDLTAYCLSSLKYQEMMKNHYYDNWTTLVQPVIDSENPRYVSHILIQVADVTENTDEDGNTTYTLNPTEEETAKLNEVLEALKTKEFEEVAKEYSDDGSAEDGGLLGLVYASNASNYVSEFADVATTIECGTVSDVVETQYGYHIITAKEATNDELYEDEDFNTLITNNNPNEDLKVIMNKAEEFGMEIKDETIKEYVNSYLEDSSEEEAGE